MIISYEDFAKEVFKSLESNGFKDPMNIADFCKIGIEVTVQNGKLVTMTYYRSTTLLNNSNIKNNK
jgi:hypothetical protein